MKHLIRFFLVMVLFSIVTLPVYAEPVLEPYTYYATFDSGSVGAWSSYPPAQDTAYDPSIWVKPLAVEKGAEGERALYREIMPNYEIDYEFGVRKKFAMYVDRSSILSFRCNVKSYSGTSGVRVRFGFGDGTEAVQLIPFTDIFTWKICTIRLADVLSSDAPKQLTAVAFMAVCPHADTEVTLRFGLDDVRIAGKREAIWDFSSPEVHRLDEWSDLIAGTHFQEGGEITLSGNPSFNARSVSVQLSRALTGEDEKTYSMKRASGNSWSVTIPLEAGIWRATLQASSREKKGDTCTTSLVFLVKRKDSPNRHPWLLMNPDDSKKILLKASSGRMKTILDRIKKRADDFRENNKPENFVYNLDAYDQIYWLPTYGGYISAIRTPSGYIRNNGIVYGLSGDREAGDATRSALLKMAEWPSYVHPHILNQGQFTYWPVGQILIELAVGYDMVYNHLNPSERKKIAEALRTNGFVPVFKEYVRDNRVSSNTSNWIGDVTGGGILCAVAIMNEYPAEELEPYLTGMILKQNSLIEAGFGKDGSYGEGFSYLNHAMHCMVESMPALDRHFGIRFNPKLAQCHRFLFYQMDLETRDLYDFGDTTNRLGSMSSFVDLITRYRDPYLKWLYDLAPGSSEVDLFLLDESVEAKGPEDLPTIAYFSDVGTVVFRNGFGHEDFQFIFRCGPFYNHQHFDQGGFYLCDRGEVFLTECGRAGYYDDPWYQKLYIQPGGHNCILVDGNPESQRHGDLLHDVPSWGNCASIADFVSYDGGGFVSGRLDPLYKGKLSTLNRSVLYIAPRTIVLIDEAVSAGDTREMNLRFHAPVKDDISTRGNDALITRPGGKLTIHTASPGMYTADIVKRPMSLYEFRSEDAVTMKTRGFLQLNADIGREITTFVNVLSTDGDIMSSLDTSAYSGYVTLDIGGTSYLVNTSGQESYTSGSTTTDALVYAGTLNGFIAMRAKSLIRNGKKVLSAEKPICVVFIDDTVKKVEYSAQAKAALHLPLDKKPGQVVLDGARLKGWKFSKKDGFTLTLPEGSGVIEIKY